jgi:hypothetical protein
VKAIITGGIDDRISRNVGYDIGVAITGHGKQA